MWKKNGKSFINPLVLNGRLVFNPSKDQLLEAGYQWVPPEQKNNSGSAVRYSSLKIIRALGAQWEAVRTQLEAAGYLDQFLSANYILSTDPAFQLFLSNFDTEFLTELEKCRWTQN